MVLIDPPEEEESESFSFPEPEKISPPLLQLDEVTFGYSPEKLILKDVNIDVGLDSRITIVGPNGAGKSTAIKLLTGMIQPIKGTATLNSRVRIAYFTQHHIDSLDVSMSPVAFLQSKFPGKTEQEYRSHLGNFGITGLTGLQKISSLSVRGWNPAQKM
jgi:ATP-binding cassette subfamily F protein 3